MSENNKTLNDILKNYQEIEMKLVESKGEVDESLETLLSLNESELSNKMDGYEKFTRYLKGQVEYLHNMEEHYNKRKKILENSIKRCKDSMLIALTSTDKEKIKTKEFNFSIGKTQKWSIDTTVLSDYDKKQLINNGHAENLFKIHLNKLKSSFKSKEKPDWINVQENSFIRVS